MYKNVCYERVAIFTGCNEVAKDMFLHVCVCPHGGEYLDRYPPGPGTPPWDQVHPSWDHVHPPGTRYTPLDQVHPPGPGTSPWTRYTPLDQVHYLPPQADGYCCGWYASYWNAFLYNYGPKPFAIILFIFLLFQKQFLKKYLSEWPCGMSFNLPSSHGLMTTSFFSSQ